jgi:hypothetical protein
VAAALTPLAVPGAAQALPVPLASVACPSASQCTAVGKGQEGTFNPVSPSGSTTTPATIDSGGSLTGVACPTGSKYCTAVDAGGQEVTFERSEEPGSVATVSGPVTIDANGSLRSVACPSETQCTAVDRYGYEVTFDPISGDVVAGSFQRIDSGSLESVACPAEKQCTAVDFNGYEVTFEPSSSTVISLVRLEVGDLSGVACPSSTQCTAVDSGGHEVTFEPASPGEPTPEAIDGATALTGVACPTEKQCTAVDSNGHEVTFEPELATTILSPTTIDGGNGPTGVACPTKAQCTAVDPHGHELTFEPTSGKTNPSGTTIGGGPVASAAKSSISVTPIPTLLSGLAGSASFEATVTLEAESGEPVPGDAVTLEVADGLGSLREGIVDDPRETDSEGKATFDFTCPAGYCTAGDLLTVTATDEDGPSLGPITDPVGEIQFAGNSYAGQPDTLEIEDLGGAETETNDKPVALSLNGSPVEHFGPCTTSSSGSLPLAGEPGACTFTVPSIPFPKGQPPPASIPAVVTVGARELDVTFPLQPTPSVGLSPESGLERSVISIDGAGFGPDAPVKVGFTPHGGSAPSASTECQTNDNGEIVNDEPMGDHDSCDLEVPADSPAGAATVSVEGYATAIATFTVEPPTLVGIGIASNLAGNVGGVGGHLYLGETATLEIEGHYNTGTIKSLEVPAGAVSWSPEPQPSGAIELKEVNGHTVGLTAKERTKSTGAGVVKVTYKGFEAKSEPIEVTHEPCKGCTYVNGALLNVKLAVPGPYPTYVSGAIANITQGVGSAPVFTLPPPCIPENGACAGTGYPELEESATETCTTLGTGECQLIAGEGTVSVATEIEDTVTLTAPAGYSVTGASGCHEVTGPPEAPVCHVLLGEFSNPLTITYDLKRWPFVTVKVGGPEVVVGQWENEDLNGVVATITPSNSTTPVAECVLEGGEHTEVLGEAGKQASCASQLEPGSYDVSVGPKIPSPEPYVGNIYVSSFPDPQQVTANLGEEVSVSFNTGFEPTVTVNVGGPEVVGGQWDNEDLNGAVATFTPSNSTTPVAECVLKGGEHTEVLGEAGKQATCSSQLEPGSYDVSVGPRITSPEPYVGNLYVTSEDPQRVTVGAGEQGSVSFNTAFEPKLANSASGTSTNPAAPATAIDGTALSATATGGTGTVIVGQYEADPAGAPTFVSGGPYIDVFLAPGNTFKELSFTDCDLEGGEYLLWYENGLWPVVSDETSPSGSPPCVTVTINEGTTPTLKQMTGTVFGVALPPKPTPPSSTLTPPSSTLPPATTAATGSVSLVGSTMTVRSSGKTAVKLTCTGTATCAGKLTLTVKHMTKRGRKKKTKTQAVGTASFSIPAGKTTTVELTLDAAGKALLGAAHGHLGAELTIAKSSPSPAQTQTKSVHLSQQLARGRAGDKHFG